MAWHDLEKQRAYEREYRKRRDAKRKKAVRQRRWYASTLGPRLRKQYEEIIAKLGGPACVKCGSTNQPTLDHIHNDREWCTKRTNREKRIKLLRKEAEEGKLQILCLSCNSAKHPQRRTIPYRNVPTPQERPCDSSTAS